MYYQLLESQNIKQNLNFNSIDFQFAQLLAEKETFIYKIVFFY